jgi:hypothetical protein
MKGYLSQFACRRPRNICPPFVRPEAQFAPDGYLSHSRTPNILWFRKSGCARHLIRDLYGAGSTATACSSSRQKSLQRLRDLGRLKRKVNISRLSSLLSIGSQLQIALALIEPIFGFE